MTAAATTRNRSWVVVDNSAWAWRNVADEVKDAFYANLDADFVFDNRAQLDAAATALFGPALITQWWKRGFPVMFGPDNDATMLRRPKNLPHHEVWDDAARHLDPHAVVIKAGLDDELLRYAAAHPRPEHLAHHGKALRVHTDPLRAELRDRLQAWADTFDDSTCQRAHDQHDGWQAAIDTATAYAQLERLRAELPV